MKDPIPLAALIITTGIFLVYKIFTSMSSNMRKKINILLATLFPLGYAAYFMLFVSGVLMDKNKIYVGMPPALVFLGLLHVTVALWQIGLLIYYIRHVLNNNILNTVKGKLAWIVGVFLGNVFAMFPYWYLYIWKESAGTPQKNGA